MVQRATVMVRVHSLWSALTPTCVCLLSPLFAAHNCVIVAKKVTDRACERGHERSYLYVHKHWVRP